MRKTIQQCGVLTFFTIGGKGIDPFASNFFTLPPRSFAPPPVGVGARCARGHGGLCHRPPRRVPLGRDHFWQISSGCVGQSSRNGHCFLLFSREHSSETVTKGQTDSSSHRRGQQHMLAYVSLHVEFFAYAVF